MKTEEQIFEQYALLVDQLDERARRIWAASEALTLGYGGIALVSRATGIAPSTVGKGIRELRTNSQIGARADGRARIRTAGGGRKTKVQNDKGLLEALDRLVEPTTRGDPESALRWTSKSVRNLAAELAAEGHTISFRTVSTLLKQQGYSLQGNRKTLEGKQHVDRDAQFQHIAAAVVAAHVGGNPAISVDTKKKELVGNYKNRGLEWQAKGEPVKVDSHDFMGELGRASPYGVYDIGDNTGWVSVGISGDTGEFAVNTVRKWWQAMGVERYENATQILVTADCGGSDGNRLRLWKLELQKLVNELAISIKVCHTPPGTSKWNKIEHRMFSFISLNWRGKPLVDYRTIVELIGATKTTTGLTIRCKLDTGEYMRSRKVSDAEMGAINITHDTFHGEWNYTIHPQLAGV